MPDSFRIRPARRGDREGIAKLLAGIGYPNACDSSTLSWVISHPEIEVHVAVDPMDHVVGVLSLSYRPQLRLKGRIASIDELVVAEDWRGKGIGKELTAQAVTRSKVLGCKRLEVCTHSRESGTAFLGKLGFTEVDSGVMRLTALEAAKR